MRQLPDEIKNYQEDIKAETIDKVQNAINELQAEGAIITRKLLRERASVSNSVLSKPHIIEVLKKNKVCQFSIKKKISVTNNNDVLLELSKATKKIVKLEEKVKDLENRLNKEKVEYYKLKEDNEILRGKLHILMQKVRLKGLVLDD